ncbi:hypothetical protein KI387_007914, partial [Taxus chinensis]
MHDPEACKIERVLFGLNEKCKATFNNDASNLDLEESVAYKVDLAAQISVIIIFLSDAGASLPKHRKVVPNVNGHIQVVEVVLEKKKSIKVYWAWLKADCVRLVKLRKGRICARKKPRVKRIKSFFKFKGPRVPYDIFENGLQKAVPSFNTQSNDPKWQSLLNDTPQIRHPPSLQTIGIKNSEYMSSFPKDQSIFPKISAFEFGFDFVGDNIHKRYIAKKSEINDQLGDVLHWIRQAVALVCGLIWGVIPLVGAVWLLV